jgi:uncharacterized membrane protein
VRVIVRLAAKHLLEAVAIPMVLFYELMTHTGLTWAIVAALLWSFTAIGRRIVTHQRVPAILVLGTILFIVRSAIAMAAHSAFIYFLQPTLATYATAAVFLVSVPLGKPLTERLAHDFCPLPDNFSGHAFVRRFFERLSLMWALVYITNATATLVLLLTQSVGSFMLIKSVASPILTGTAIVTSYLWFRRTMRDEKVVLRWGHVEAPPVPVPVPAAASAPIG